MTPSRCVVLGALAALVFGCGGEEKATVDPAPFKAALEEHLRLGSMDMKPEKFESLEVTGDQAVAKVRMATKEDLYGVKPLWTVAFKKAGDTWQVVTAGPERKP